MKFTPRHIEENVNVSTTHPLAELGWLVGGLLLLVLVGYIVLGVATEIAVARIPIRAEAWLGEQFTDSMEALQSEALQARLVKLLDRLPADSPLHEYDFSVHLVENEEINALALPGGHIIVFTGLVEQAESENEVAMVLAHELGHFAHRDHLRRLGRGLSLALGAFLLFGEDGHAGGDTDFFARVGKEAGSRIPYLLASHPHPGDRVRELQNLIAAHGYRVDTVTPLGQDLLKNLPVSKESPGKEPASAAGN